MKLLNKSVRVRANPYIITTRRIFFTKVGIELSLFILSLNAWLSLSFPIRLIALTFFIGLIILFEKGFRSKTMINIKRIVFVREALFDMLISLNLYEVSDNVVINTATLDFKITPENDVIIRVPLFGNKFLKTLKNLEEYLVPTLGLPLISKKEFPDYIIYQLGHIEEVEQYVFNSQTLTREFFEDIPNPIIKLSNTQQFSLKLSLIHI